MKAGDLVRTKDNHLEPSGVSLSRDRHEEMELVNESR